MTSLRLPTPLARFAAAATVLLCSCRAPEQWTTPHELRAFADQQNASLAECFGLDESLHARKLLNLQRAHAQNPERYLLLPGVARLSPAEAKVIAGWSGSVLSLPDLERASPAVLQDIVAAGCTELFLGGLTELTTEQAREITAWNEQGKLYLTGLQTISQEVAEVLAAWGTTRTESYLVLDGVDHLSAEAASSLMRGEVWALSLSRLTELDAGLAEAFAGDMRATLRLNGLETLPADSQPAFERWSVKFLWFDGIQELGAGLAESMARSASDVIFLNGVRELSLEVAKILSTAKPDSFYMLGVRELSAEVREYLTSKPHKLTLNRGVL
jgi:hypothetical protein